MSDDLISRKAVLDILTEERMRNSILASPAFTEILVQRVKDLPTAFNKEKVIAELSKRIPMPAHFKHPKILTDVQRAEKLVTDRNVKITSLSKATGISTYTLYNYRKNPASLHKASQATVDCLTSKYFETYFSRNEIERFRMMLINIVGAYLKETEGNPIAYDPAHALYTMCQKGDWHRLAKMEELWRASYSVERSL